MQPFEYTRPTDLSEALAAGGDDARYLAGGTNLVDLMKGGVEAPRRVVDINRLPLAAIEPLPDGGLRIGALVRNADCAADPAVRSRYPLLAQALLSGASPQLRNMATVGGNLLQRTRCPYFVDTAYTACNKRSPGSGCAAREGYHRMHAILGASPACVAVHPSDMAAALLALGARVEVRSPRGTRRLAVDELLRLPENTPERDHVLAAGELIVAVELPSSPFAAHSHYLKVRDRASFSFALVSVAAALAVKAGRVQEARVVLGGVAHRPWRAAGAEELLEGGALTRASIEAAASAAVSGAEPLRDNVFKVELTRRAVARALATAGGIA